MLRKEQISSEESLQRENFQKMLQFKQRISESCGKTTDTVSLK